MFAADLLRFLLQPVELRARACKLVFRFRGPVAFFLDISFGGRETLRELLELLLVPGPDFLSFLRQPLEARPGAFETSLQFRRLFADFVPPLLGVGEARRKRGDLPFVLAAVTFSFVAHLFCVHPRGFQELFERRRRFALLVPLRLGFHETRRELRQFSLHDEHLAVATGDGPCQLLNFFVLSTRDLAQAQKLARKGRAPSVTSRMLQLSRESFNVRLQLGQAFRGELAFFCRDRVNDDRRFRVNLRQDPDRLLVQALHELGIQVRGRARLLYRVGVLR